MKNWVLFALIIVGAFFYWIFVTPMILMVIGMATYDILFFSFIYYIALVLLVLIPIYFFKTKFKDKSVSKKRLFYLFAVPIIIYSSHTSLTIADLDFYSYMINNKVNSINEVNVSCQVDSDCEMKQIDCASCRYSSRGEAVNKIYEPTCPISTSSFCPTAEPDWAMNFQAVCENNLCVKKEFERSW